MGTIGTFDVNIGTFGQITNNSTLTAAYIMGEIADQGSLIGLAIAISIALTLIFGAIFIVINFIPALIKKVKGINRP